MRTRADGGEGRVRAAILDWAGTTVDHGCMAPVGVFVELFRRRGVEVTLQQARAPMGTHKREHVRIMCAMPEVRRAFARVHGREPGDADVDAMYAEGTGLQIACLPDHAEPIEGVVEAVAALRGRGIGIGSTTGYNREMLDVLRAAAAARGYAPDVAVAASEVPEGRPAPYMNWTAAMRLGAWPASACVAVGDTEVDVRAGLAAGMWTVGVALTGNEVGRTAAEWASLPGGEREGMAEVARARLRDSGAHFVVDALRDVLPCIDAIEARMGRGERP